LIVSASRRTDIPAFFGDWFISRLKEGFIDTVNPFNSNQVSRYNLLPNEIEAIVFWTKNPKPFLKHIDYLKNRGFHFYFQYTLNDYPLSFEPFLPSISERIQSFKTLSDLVGKDRVLWRFDPIIISNKTPAEYIVERIKYLAGELQGRVESLTISFMDYYGKVTNRLRQLSKDKGLQFSDITSSSEIPALKELSNSITKIAHEHNMEVVSCAEKIDLDDIGIKHGHCIDASLISRLFGISCPYKKDKNQRAECLCSESIDIGAYNTCKHECVYCYANYSHSAIEGNLRKHSDSSTSILQDTRNSTNVKIKTIKRKTDQSEQSSLFVNH
jgi:DNA repair photolyase